MERIKKFSERFYITCLALAIPFYLMAYGAIGHQFRSEPEDRTWLIVITLSLITTIAYLITRSFKGKAITFIKVIFGLTLLMTGTGAALLFWPIVNFDYGNDTAFLVKALFFLIPVVFIFSVVILGYWLLKSVK